MVNRVLAHALASTVARRVDNSLQLWMEDLPHEVVWLAEEDLLH